MKTRARTARGGGRRAGGPAAPVLRNGGAAVRTPGAGRYARVAPSLLSIAASLAVGVLLAIAVLAVEVGLPTKAGASPEYGGRTGKECDYCHVTPGGPLTATGEAFKANGYDLPTSPTTTAADGGGGGVPSPGTTMVTTPAGAADEVSTPVLSLGRGLKGLLRWVHVVGVIAWFGGIFTVFFVQGREVAVTGIPRAYLRLAWPAIALVGVSGVILLLDDVTAPRMLVETRWGLLLVTKIGVFLLLVLIAAVATLLISPRLERAAAAQPPPGRSQEEYRAQGRITVGYRGRVYDVTGSRRWPEGRHVKKHDAWEDLSSALADAPHGPEVLERFILLEDMRAAGAGTDQAIRVFYLMTALVVGLMLAAVLVVAFW